MDSGGISGSPDPADPVAPHQTRGGWRKVLFPTGSLELCTLVQDRPGVQMVEDHPLDFFREVEKGKDLLGTHVLIEVSMTFHSPGIYGP